MMEKENLTNPIDEDLERRNRNWDKIDKLKEDLEEEVGELRDDLAEHKLDYAEYLESELGEEHIIRSLPNGVKDEIDVTQRKIIKRTKKYILRARDIPMIALHSSTNTLCAVIQIPSDGLYSAPINERARLERYSGNLISFYSAGGQLGIPVDEETTIEQARDMLAGTTLIYQLAEPEIIDLPEVMSPNTREIVRLSEQVDKLTSAIIALGGTIV